MHAPTDRSAAFQTPTGGFAMVAIDQRESLREMFPRLGDEIVPDARLSEFKTTAMRILGPLATGILLDHPLGVPGPGRPAALPESCALLLAADDLHSVPGQGVQGSSVDERVTPELIASTGAKGIKFLVIWRRGDTSWKSELDRFHALADESGVATFVEGIVRPAIDGSWRSAADRHEAILEAAEALSPRATVYKAEVPGYSAGELDGVEENARLLSRIVDGPWVVLSNGVQRDDFAEAVRLSCAGGARGFLAGRAIWADTLDESDPASALAERSTRRLTALRLIVDSARA